MSETTNAGNETRSEDSGAPLAWGLHGDRIDVPAHAQGWRVKRLNAAAGRAGAPEVVYANGIPLFLPMSATVQELSEAVDGIPGKYRLDPVDDGCKPIANAAPAYVMLGGSASNRDGEPMSRVLDSVERLARVNAEAMEKLSSQLSAIVDAASRLVNAADSAGVTRRELAALPIQVAADQQPAQESPVNASLVQVIEAVRPYVPNIMAWIVSRMTPGAVPGGAP